VPFTVAWDNIKRTSDQLGVLEADSRGVGYLVTLPTSSNRSRLPSGSPIATLRSSNKPRWQTGLHMTVAFRAADRVREGPALQVRLAGTSIYYHSMPRPDEFILGFSSIGSRTMREGIRRISGA
jgi:hypothetical protein